MPFDADTTFYRKALNENAFIISELFSVAAGGTVNIHLENPSDSDKRIFIVDTKVTGDGSYIGKFYDGFSSAPSGGTALEIQNIYLDSENDDTDGTAVANKNTSFTANSEHVVGVSGGGAGGTSIGGESHNAYAIMDPGREAVIQVENTSASTNNYAINILYFETTE